MFDWGSVETLGLPPSAILSEIGRVCDQDKFVIDGWHLSDSEGEHMPVGSVVYVVYAPYEKIISQYRIPVNNPEEYRNMFAKWYSIDYARFPGVRFFENTGDFEERTYEDFVSVCGRQ